MHSAVWAHIEIASYAVQGNVGRKSHARAGGPNKAATPAEAQRRAYVAAGVGIGSACRLPAVRKPVAACTTRTCAAKLKAVALGTLRIAAFCSPNQRS